MKTATALEQHQLLLLPLGREHTRTRGTEEDDDRPIRRVMGIRATQRCRQVPRCPGARESAFSNPGPAANDDDAADSSRIALVELKNAVTNHPLLTAPADPTAAARDQAGLTSKRPSGLTPRTARARGPFRVSRWRCDARPAALALARSCPRGATRRGRGRPVPASRGEAGRMCPS